MLSCNGLSLNYAIVLYDKTRSKIDIVQSIINELPRPPHSAYFLCDSWYASNKLMDALLKIPFRCKRVVLCIFRDLLIYSR